MERQRKLKLLIDSKDTELDLDRKMVAVVARSDQPELFNIVRTLFHTMTEDGTVNLDGVPHAWEQIEKFELDAPFWEMVRSNFGYDDENPSLRNLLIRLFVSDLAHHLGPASPSSLEHLTAHVVQTIGTLNSKRSCHGEARIHIRSTLSEQK